MERRKSTSTIFASSGVAFSMMPSAIFRRREVFPHSVSPKATRRGCASKSSTTGASSDSSIPIAIFEREIL
ncbi:Uncharacterised protein [Mycobacteroides abscessus subsp. abscessus]|nr:Uncharacterised protein [Mycobacteroides abscessus subsp. abscessus]